MKLHIRSTSNGSRKSVVKSFKLFAANYSEKAILRSVHRAFKKGENVIFFKNNELSFIDSKGETQAFPIMEPKTRKFLGIFFQNKGVLHVEYCGTNTPDYKGWLEFKKMGPRVVSNKPATSKKSQQPSGWLRFPFLKLDFLSL